MPTANPSFSRRAVLSVAAALALASASAPAMSFATGFTPYTKAAFDAALKSEKPVLVHIHAEWCPVCKKQETVFNELAKTEQFSRIKAFVVDFDKDTDFRKAYGASNQSVVLVFKSGKEVARSGGVTDKALLGALLDSAAN